MPQGYLGRAVLEFSANTAKFDSDVGKAAVRFNKSMDAMGRGIKNLAYAFGATVSIGGFALMIKNTANAADAMAKMSQKVGVSVESLSAFNYAAELSGVSSDTMSTSLAKLAKNAADMQIGLGDARYAFDAMKISVTDASGQLKSTETLFKEVAEQFAGMEDGAGKTALAMKIFGRSGAELIPLLNQGAAGFEEMRSEAEKLGIILDTKTAKAAEEFNDNLTRLSRRIDGLKIELLRNLIEPLGEVAQNFVEAAKAAEGFWQALIIGGQGAPRDLGSLVAQIKDLEGARIELEKEADALAKADLLGLEKIKGAEVTHQLRLVEARLRMLKSLAESIGKTAGAGFGGQLDVPGAKRVAPGLVDQTKLDAAAKAMAAAAKKAEDAWRKGLADAVNEANKNAIAWIESGKEVDALLLKQATDAGNLAAQFVNMGDGTMIPMERFNKQLGTVQDKSEKMKETAMELGNTFVSAFEDAALAGAKLSDVLKGLAKDIARVILRKTVTEPLQTAVSGIDFGKLFGSSSDNWLSTVGYGYASGGRPPVGVPSLVGEQGPELFVPDVSGTVVKNGDLGGSTYYIDARGADVGQIKRLEGMIISLGGRVPAMAVSAVSDARRRGALR